MAKCIELQDFKAFAVQKQKTLVINVTVVIQIYGETAEML